MRFQALITLLLLIAFADGTPAIAQPQAGANSNIWHAGVGLLGYVRVRDELKLTDEQQQKIKPIGDEYLERHVRPTIEASRNLSLEEQRKKQAELEKPALETYEAAKRLLTPEQATRLRQIEIWVNGPAAFGDPQLVRELDLTVEQQGALKSVADEYRNELAANAKKLSDSLFPRAGRDKAGTKAKIDESNKKRKELRAAKDEECQAILTAEQKNLFIKLRGEKFELGRP